MRVGSSRKECAERECQDWEGWRHFTSVAASPRGVRFPLWSKESQIEIAVIIHRQPFPYTKHQDFEPIHICHGTAAHHCLFCLTKQNLLVGQGAPKGKGDDGQDLHSSEESSDSDSDDDLLQTRRVTAENLQLPGEVQGRQQQSLIQVVSESCEREEELSDGEVTVASSASGER